MKINPLKGFIVFVLVLLLSMTLTAAAQDDVDDVPEDTLLFEIIGAISFDDDSISVEGITLAPASAFNPSLYADGDLVIVTGYLLNDDTLFVLSLDLYDECEDVDAADTTDECDIEEADEADDEDVEDIEDGDDAEDEADDEDTTDTPVHPIALTLSQEFGIDYEIIVAWHAAGLGYGQIAMALALAAQLDDVEAEDVIEQLLAGTPMGELFREYEVSPASLAPGRVISNRPDSVGRPDGVGRPGGNDGESNRPGNAGRPESAGQPANPGNQPESPGGRPEHAGPPANPGGGNPGGGPPANPGPPQNPGNPGGGNPGGPPENPGGGRGGGGGRP